MGNKKFLNGGFVFAEFAIALPLLILLGWGLVNVSAKIFEQGKRQLADYVLEEEVHEVLSRIIYDARAAKEVEAVEGSPTLKFTYRTINEIQVKGGGINPGDVIADKEEHRVYILHKPDENSGEGTQYHKIYYQRRAGEHSSPITGDNYFGLTEVETFDFYPDKDYKNVLHVTLELKSIETGHKIKISTAVYMPGCEKIIS